MSEIKEKQKAKLAIKLPDNSLKEFDCSVKEVFDDRLLLNFPQEVFNYMTYLEEGQELPVKVFTPTGVQAFNSIVLNSPMESDFVIEYALDHVKIQRREYLRAAVEAKIIIERFDNDNVAGLTIDISGGGIRFSCNGQIDSGEMVKCVLYLPQEVNSIKATGLIIKNEYMPEDQYVMVFSEIDEKDRDKIIKKGFEIDSQRRRLV